MYVIGDLEDQIVLLVWSKLSTSPFFINDLVLANFPAYTYIFGSLLNPWQSNQPILSFVVSLLLTFGGANGLNSLIALSMVLNLVCSYLFFKRFKFGILYTLMFVFSAYTWTHLGRHLDLMQIWLVPLFFYLMDKYFIKKPFVIGIYLALAGLTVNYYGYFLALYLGAYAGAHLFLTVVFQKHLDKGHAQKVLASFIVSLCFVVLIIGAVLFKYISINYISGAEVHNPDKIVRPLEDFMIFSSRPWYFFIPPVKNPLVGHFAQSALAKIESTNYFLADDYFASEHSGNYIGSLLFLSTLAMTILVFKLSGAKVRSTLLANWLVLAVLFTLMLPPFFTVSGITLWSPGYILSKLFPMFRVTARLSIVVLPAVLVLLGTCIDYVYTNFAKHQKHLVLLVSGIALVTLVETFIPPEIRYYGAAPDVYRYMSTDLSPSAVFAVYPYDEADVAFFWLPTHHKNLLNLRDYATDQMSSASFSTKLITNDGLAALKSFGGNYVVVYKYIPTSELTFFLTTQGLVLQKDFKDTYLFKVTGFNTL